MKVLLINGSPNKNGCTNYALLEAEKELNKANIETSIIHIGNKPIRGCTACKKCYTERNKCVFNDDIVNEIIDMSFHYDGLIIGSPVYYASANGSLVAALDRIFYAGNGFSHKPGACIVSARRAGTTSTIDQLNKYFLISNMPVVPSQYWTMVHGNNPDEVKQDLEGLQIVRTMARNMVWMLKCIEAGKEKGIQAPSPEERVRTNFIR
ncbi:MAG TPA: flavodoxin family protein [Bacteroidales bacterium]|nr:flavodoxin family protein [Bacteroidales bacterium]HPT11370.1 flavodoxin family protein [Bacteroidales bacterium]